MKEFKRSFATLLAATLLMTGLVFAPISAEETEVSEPVAAEETEVSEPVATQELVEMEGSLAPVNAEGTSAEDVSRFVRISSDNGNGTSDGIRLDGETIEENSYQVREIRSITDLINALGGTTNVKQISDTEIQLTKNINNPNASCEYIEFHDGTYVIDFRAYVISGSWCFVAEAGSNVTYKDSLQSQGGITSAPILDANGQVETAFSAIGVGSGKVTILSGRYRGYYCGLTAAGGPSSAGARNAGELSIKGGIITCSTESEYAISAEIYPNIKLAEITGGTFIGQCGGLEVYRDLLGQPDTSETPNVKISGGTLYNTVYIKGYGAITYYDRNSRVYPNIHELFAEDYYLSPGYVGKTYDSDFNMAYSCTATNINPTKPDQVTGFVNRLYTSVLGRNADTIGKRDWVNQLLNREISGAQAAYGFFFSPELTNRNLSDRDFVTLLYNVFLNRTPDSTGMQAWLSALDSGASRYYIFSGFANSAEWKSLCAGYAITAGSYTSPEPRDQNIKVTAFVQRLYSLCLNRKADVTGLNDWTGALVKKTKDGAHVAYGFFFSAEFTARNLSNADYVEVLYQVLLGRGSDSVGRANWVAQLEGGKSRLEIFKGFVHSAEFDAICKDYGIVRGSM